MIIIYSGELDTYIKNRNYSLTADEMIFVTNIKEHPQINNIKYDPYNQDFELWTSDNYYWKLNFKKIMEEYIYV